MFSKKKASKIKDSPAVLIISDISNCIKVYEATMIRQRIKKEGPVKRKDRGQLSAKDGPS